MKKYKVLIIGAGRISSGYDNPNSRGVLTHCHALLNNNRFIVLGFYDSDFGIAKKAALKWNTKKFDSIEECRKADPDIVLICTPDGVHAQYLDMVVEWRPKMVICEKPLTNNLKESIRIVSLYELSSITLMVVYQRRYDRDINTIRKKIISGEFGKFLTGTLLYSKGLLHNGSHGIDLLNFLFGEVMRCEFHSKRNDFNEFDPSISARLTFECGDIILLNGDERSHSLFEVDLIFQNKRIKLLDSGFSIELHDIVPDPMFEGYRNLSRRLKRKSTLNNSLAIMWDRVADSIDTGISLPTSAREALKTQIICNELTILSAD